MPTAQAAAWGAGYIFVMSATIMTPPEKPIQYWMALLAGALIVFVQHKGKAFKERIIMVIISVALGVGFGGEVAEKVGLSENAGIFFVSVFGYTVIDIIAQSTMLSRAVERVTGMKINDDDD